MNMPETGPALRRYFVNTIFDSTFVILGVIIGSAFSPDPSYSLVIAIVLTSSFALGISTGVRRMSGKNPLLRGLRMGVIGVGVFLICFWIQTLI